MHVLSSNGPLTKKARDLEINTWNQLIQFIAKLPYGRNKNRSDFSLVFDEKKGTCSSKHALIKAIANENNIPNVKHWLGMYRMSSSNTPIKVDLLQYGLKYIPEAHCYLSIENDKKDFTHAGSQFETIRKNLISEMEITPEQLISEKIIIHQQYLKDWIRSNQIKMTYEEVWNIREKCIVSI